MTAFIVGFAVGYFIAAGVAAYFDFKERKQNNLLDQE